MTRHSRLSGDRRIAMISPRYSPDVGGVEQVAERVATGLARRGVPIDVLTTDPSRRLPRRANLDGVPVYRFPTLGRDSVYFASPSLARWLHQHARRYRLLHVQSYHTALALEVALVSMLTGIPFVVNTHYHGGGHTLLRRALHVPYAPLGRWMLRSARRTICSSEAEAQLVRRHVGRNLPITVIPPGIDLDEIRSVRPVETPPSGVTVLAVGRLEPYKQTSRVLDALPLLPDEYEVTIIGDGPAREQLATAITRTGLHARARLLGSVPRPTLIGWYRAANVFVSLSVHEAFGITLAEAAAAGAAVVASDIPAHREVATYLARDRVFLVPPDSPPRVLAATIRAAAAARVANPVPESTLSWDRAAADVLDVYEAVLQSPLSAARSSVT